MLEREKQIYSGFIETGTTCNENKSDGRTVVSVLPFDWLVGFSKPTVKNVTTKRTDGEYVLLGKVLI